MNQQDTDYVEVKYNHRNKGTHPVYGGATGEFYGYRSGGDTFIVHKQDAAAQPTLFQEIVDVATAPKINYKVPKQSPPPPTPMMPVTGEPTAKSLGAAMESASQRAAQEQVEKVLSGNLENIMRPLDLQTLPGVTPTIAKRMAAEGLDTKEAILSAGHSGLTAIKGIADARAGAIIEYLSD